MPLWGNNGMLQMLLGKFPRKEWLLNMANKKKGQTRKGQPEKAQPKAEPKAQSKPEEKQGKKADPKKIAIVVAIIAIVVVVSVYLDYTVRNPRVASLDDAHNQIFGQRVLADTPYETPVELAGEQDPVEIGGKKYWKVDIIFDYDTPQAKTLTYYVAANNSKIYIMDEATQQMVPYGV